MAEALPASSSPSRAKKRAVRRRSGPTVRQLITQTVAASSERNGVSLAALKKALAAVGYDVQKNRTRIKLAVKGLVSRGVLVRTKGGSGSLMMGKRVPRRRRRRRVGKRATRRARRPAKGKRARKTRRVRRARTSRKSPKRTRRARGSRRKARRTRKTVRKTAAKRATAKRGGKRRARRTRAKKK